MAWIENEPAPRKMRVQRTIWLKDC